jgi:hypothetical protein
MPAVFTPPHTPPVFRVLKQAWRDYKASGNAAQINVTTPPTHAANTTTVVAGTVEVAAGVPLPPTVTAILYQGASVKGTLSATVDPVTAVYTTTFPAHTATAGATTAKVSSDDPIESTTTPAFTLT